MMYRLKLDRVAKVGPFAPQLIAHALGKFRVVQNTMLTGQRALNIHKE